MKTLIKTTIHTLLHQLSHLGAHRFLFLILRPVISLEAAEHVVGRLALPLTICFLMLIEVTSHQVIHRIKRNK